MRDESIGGFLDGLASSAPAPGGGAVAALEAAMAAALVEMVCNLTIGKPAHALYEETMRKALERAGELRVEAQELAGEDAAAFAAVIDAYRLARETEPEREARAREIQRALAVAADVPRRTALVAAEVVGLAESIVAGANPNVVSDLAASAASARAALEAALVNIEINRASIDDVELGSALGEAVRMIERDRERAQDLVDAVRLRLTP
jgi:formiminotetrahydrofolate cyclodeaminase